MKYGDDTVPDMDLVLLIKGRFDMEELPVPVILSNNDTFEVAANEYVSTGVAQKYHTILLADTVLIVSDQLLPTIGTPVTHVVDDVISITGVLEKAGYKLVFRPST